MKISKFIEMLNEVKEKHGDLEVYCWPYDGQQRLYNIGDENDGKLFPVESPMAEGRKVLFIE